MKNFEGKSKRESPRKQYMLAIGGAVGGIGEV